jgi:hypothetical protein
LSFEAQRAKKCTLSFEAQRAKKCTLSFVFSPLSKSNSAPGLCYVDLKNEIFSVTFRFDKMIMLRGLLFILLIVPFLSNGQQQNFRSKSELGVLLGGSFYNGDLNQFRVFYNTHAAGGLVYRYNIHSRLSFRANVLYGTVSASDADAKLSLLVNRNLSFQSDIYEVAAGVEFSYFPFKLGSDRYRGTAYLLAEIGIFHMNPKAMYEGSLVELQPLGTEGQGSSLSSKRNYGLTQLSVPIGVGCKLSLGKRASLSLEYGIRKTFTDYLDDVKANTFVDRGALAQENGAVAAALSNRNINNEAYGKRGNTATKDWYTFFGAMLTFRLGKPNVCPMNM